MTASVLVIIIAMGTGFNSAIVAGLAAYGIALLAFAFVNVRS